MHRRRAWLRIKSLGTTANDLFTDSILSCLWNSPTTSTLYQGNQVKSAVEYAQEALFLDAEMNPITAPDGIAPFGLGSQLTGYTQIVLTLNGATL